MEDIIAQDILIFHLLQFNHYAVHELLSVNRAFYILLRRHEVSAILARLFLSPMYLRTLTFMNLNFFHNIFREFNGKFLRKCPGADYMYDYRLNHYRPKVFSSPSVKLVRYFHLAQYPMIIIKDKEFVHSVKKILLQYMYVYEGICAWQFRNRGSTLHVTLKEKIDDIEVYRDTQICFDFIIRFVESREKTFLQPCLVRVNQICY